MAWIDPTQGQYAKTNVAENKTHMKKIIRLTESDLHQIIENSVRRILKEDFNQYSDGDFASTGDPYEMGDDDIDPTSDVSHLKPEDHTNHIFSEAVLRFPSGFFLRHARQEDPADECILSNISASEPNITSVSH